MAASAKLVCAVVFLFCSIGFGKESERYYLMPEKMYQLFGADKPAVIKSEGGFVLVKVAPERMEGLSEKIHHDLGTCGGFFDVTEEMSRAKLSGLDFSAYADPNSSQNKGKKLMSGAFAGRAIKYGRKIQEHLHLVKKERFENSLQQLTQFPDRAATTENGKRAAQWLHDQALQYARDAGRGDISAEMISTGGRYIQDSVVVKIPGFMSSGGGVLVGGHMDTFSNNKPGADDDGSGTITAQEIFKAIVDTKLTFKNDIYIAFYAAEEMGLVGSSRVVREFKNRGIELQAVLHFDMTGFLSEREPNELYFLTDYTTPELNEWTRKMATEVLQIPAEKIGQTRCGYACSDHANWNREGFPTVYPFESSFNNHNRSIHSSSDVMNRLNFDHALRFVRLGFAFVFELAEPINGN